MVGGYYVEEGGRKVPMVLGSRLGGAGLLGGVHDCRKERRNLDLIILAETKLTKKVTNEELAEALNQLKSVLGTQVHLHTDRGQSPEGPAEDPHCCTWP